MVYMVHMAFITCGICVTPWKYPNSFITCSGCKINLIIFFPAFKWLKTKDDKNPKILQEPNKFGKNVK